MFVFMYDRKGIEKWLLSNNTDPVTREVITDKYVIRISYVQQDIIEYLLNM